MTKRKVAPARKNFRHVATLAVLVLASSICLLQQDSTHAIEHDLTSFSKSQMTHLTLKKVLTAKRPAGYGSVQGFTMTDKYYVMILRQPGQDDNNRIEIIRRDNLQNVTNDFKNPTYNMGHGNDATWNSKTNEIIIVDNNRQRYVRIDAETFKVKGVFKLFDKNYSTLIGGGIAYNKDRDIYHISSGSLIRTFNKSNQLISSFKEKHHQVSQGLAYNNGYLYRSTWESAGQYNNASYDGIFKKNTSIIYQFGLDGSFTQAYFIDNPLYEIESMAFDEDNVPYLAFNGPSGHFSIYKVTKSNSLRKLQQSYTISYDSNGGNKAPSSKTAYVGIASKISQKEPIRDDYTFLGWSTNKNATKASYVPGSQFFKDYGQKNTNVKLYAVWQRGPILEQTGMIIQEESSIIFDANGGTNAPSPIPVNTDELVLPQETPIRQGHLFKGWSRQKDAIRAEYQPGDIMKDNQPQTLYAVWEALVLASIVDSKADALELDDRDDNINDASAVNDGEENNILLTSIENPSELPKTGPTEIAVLTIALVCIASGAAYWYNSNRQLKRLQRSIHSVNK